MKFMIRNLLVNMIINRRKHKTRSSSSLRECFFRCSCRKISAIILQIKKPSSFQNHQKVTKEGFTLVELISVVAIIAILAAIAIPSYGSYIIKVRIARTVTEIRMLEQAISLYKSEKDRLPDTLTDIGYAGLLDPWGHPYQYLNIADGGVKGKGKLRRDRFLNPLNSDFDLYSMGIDGDSKTNLNAKQSQDDVVRVLNGGFIGLASNF